jgi:hypothetical protein
LASRTGRGLASIRRSIRAEIDPIAYRHAEASISTGTMGIHETGGTIRPRRAKFLAIPLRPALDSRGILRAKPRDWTDTFVARSGEGNLIIFQRSFGGRYVTPLFLLRRQVTIPPRLRLGETVQHEGLTYFQSKLIQAMDKEFGR